MNGGVATPGSANSFRVVDLRPFTTYSFKVAAVNAAGRSRPSEESYYAMTLRARKYCTYYKATIPARQSASGVLAPLYCCCTVVAS